MHTDIRQITAEFTTLYVEKLFYFCLKKTGSQSEAEELAQDIALQILSALNGGTRPTNFPAWFWQIARNRYAQWADARHRKARTMDGSDIGDLELADPDDPLLTTLIRREQLSLLRRELAFISSDYRHILVAYYIENRPMAEIAADCSLSLEAVKKRLQRARKLLKEGMDMAREFGKRSYNPDQVDFVMNGREGKKGQPWSIIVRLLVKNIILETDKNPETAEELSLALGIALPYMEDELEMLVNEQLLVRNEGKYQPSFPIVSREEQLKAHEANLITQKPLTEKLCALIDGYLAAGGARADVHFVGEENARWALLVRTFDYLHWEAAQTNQEEYADNYPDRPDEGAWTLTGFEWCDYDEPAFVGQHGWLCYDENEVKFDVDFGQFKFQYANHQAKTPDHLTWQEAAALWQVCTGQEAAPEYAKKLAEYGYLRQNGEEYLPNLVIFDRSAPESPLPDLHALKEEIIDLMRKNPGISRGYVVEQALENGWLTYNESTPAAAGAFIYR